jgi:hypothetical protein
MDVEAEIRDLKRRVGELEGGFGFLTQQLRAVHLDLLSFQTETRENFDSVRSEMQDVKSGLKSEIQGVKADVAGLRENLPGIVGGAVREALREPR